MFEIGFLTVHFWDILDILIVGYLLSQLYRLLRGSIAFNIFIGVLLLYVVSWLVRQLGMDLLEAVLTEFVDLGVIIIVIIFQPEVRRFLLFLGNSTLRQRSNMLDRLMNRSQFASSEQRDRQIRSVKASVLRMARQHVGALIVLSKNVDMEGIVSSGIQLDAVITEPLIESIFNKESPLHDGAVLITGGKIKAASCVLPVSDNPNLPKSSGLRHRAGVGVTERANVAALIVSEETGRVSFAYNGQLERYLSEQRLTELLNEHYL